MRLLCPSCHGERDKQVECRRCAGSGLTRDVPYADRPLDEVYPGLWVGGHDWAGPQGPNPEDWLGSEVDPELIREHGFDTIISFYRRPGHEAPDNVVEHHFMRIPDGRLTAEELRHLRLLGTLAALKVGQGKKVFIRCQAGLNRSNLCAAFALKHLGFSSREAIDRLREARSPYVLCNAEFVRYLLEETP